MTDRFRHSCLGDVGFLDGGDEKGVLDLGEKKDVALSVKGFDVCY